VMTKRKGRMAVKAVNAVGTTMFPLCRLVDNGGGPMQPADPHRVCLPLFGTVHVGKETRRESFAQQGIFYFY